MIMLELIRVHTKLLDYRNAYKMCTKIAGKNSKNPFILSRCGRLCLEIGRKKQALNYFNHVLSMVPPGNTDNDLAIIVLLNNAFCYIYDENYTQAIE
jgi:tetratricopeptide (TPR) repeat protein